MWLCEHHYVRLRKWMKEQPSLEQEAARRLHLEQMRIEKERHEEQVRLRRELAREQRALDAERIAAEAEARAGRNVIYYLQRESDGLVKIGTTGDLADRLPRRVMVHGPAVLLATHGGGRQEETALHGQFGAQRVTIEGEWFRPELVLMKHVAGVRKKHGAPQGEKLPPVATVRYSSTPYLS